MPESIILDKKYRDEFAAEKIDDMYGERYLISAPGKSRQEVKDFAEDDLGTGSLSQNKSLEGKWVYTPQE